MKTWSLKKLTRVAAEICDYALDQYKDRNKVASGSTPWPDDSPNHNLAWSALGNTSYVLACIAAQHTPDGSGGVDTEMPFEALRMWEFMPLRKRRRLAKAFFKELGAQKKSVKGPHRIVEVTDPGLVFEPPAAPPKAPPEDDCDEDNARPFCDMDPEDLQQELEGITKTYGLWVLEAAKFKHELRGALQQSMERAMKHRMELAFCDLRHTPRVGDQVVTLNGENDCDEHDLPRHANPGTSGKVVAVNHNASVHVVFDGGCWVSLELYEICDPQQYTWEP